jgi:Soluble lytic murein transglycosylase and related regulatory proteins (some contain LysM/invasin domains)
MNASNLKNPHMLRIGVLFHGNKIWLSEYVSLISVGIILFLLFMATFLILFNESLIYINNKKIAALRAEKITMGGLLVQLSAEEKIGAALKNVLGGSISPATYYQLVDLVYNNSKTYGYDPFLVLAVMQVESVFKPFALGKYKNFELSGALGLMQLKPETAREIAHHLGIVIASDRDLFKPEINMVIGVAYLTKLISSFKSFKLGLLAYNQGPAVIKEYLAGSQPLSMDYYTRVLKSYYNLKKSAEEQMADTLG